MPRKSQGPYKNRYSDDGASVMMKAKSLKVLVGARGFEPRTSCAQGKR